MAAVMSLDTADIEFVYYPTRSLIKLDSGVVIGLCRRVFILQYLFFFARRCKVDYSPGRG